MGSYTNLLFLVIAAANTFIGIFQEIRSKKAVDRLTLLAEQKIHCIRDGEWEEVPSSDLVRDDIVEFDNGSQICADAVICSGQVTVNESMLTGETDAILKQAGDELKSGSFVNGGRCVARLSQVGSDSYAFRLAREAKRDVKLAKSEMMRSLDRLIRVIGILLVPVGIFLFINQYQMLELPVKGAMEATVAALIGMIPEGLYLLTSIAIAVGVLRLSRRKVLVRDMNCVEILARVDTLCVDKTGTITEPGMDVDRFILLDEVNFPEEAVTEMLAAFYDNMDADNDTGRAMAEHFRQDSDWEAADIVNPGRHGLYPARTKYATVRKYSILRLHWQETDAWQSARHKDEGFLSNCIKSAGEGAFQDAVSLTAVQRTGRVYPAPIPCFFVIL